MEIGLLVWHYIFWHYTRALSDIVGIAKNFIWFIYNFFSIPILTRTFFSPWKRMSENYGKGITPFLSAFVINTLMRIVGMFMRFCILIVGAFAVLIACFISCVSFFAWLLSPFLLLWLAGKGIEEILLYLSQ